MKFSLKQKFKMFSQHVIFPFVYFINRWRRVDASLVIFADSHNDSCPPQMERIRCELQRQGYNVADFFFDSSAMTGIQIIKKMSEFMKMYAGAGAVVICDNFLPVASCKKRSETKVVQLWHGCGSFKKFGYDATDDIPVEYKGDVYKNYTMVTVSGDSVADNFKSAMGITDKSVVVPIGVSYTDRLFDREYIELCRDKFRYTYPDASGKKVVLWAPSFRGNASLAKGQTASGEEAVDLLNQSEELFVIKSFHPHTIDSDRTKPFMSTGELLVCADVLITDYSSVFFEYLLMDKPIVFFAPDLGDYQGKRGFYLDYGELPGAIAKDARELENAVYTACFSEDKYEQKRAAYKASYMSACDGNATGRIAEYIGRG